MSFQHYMKKLRSLPLGAYSPFVLQRWIKGAEQHKNQCDIGLTNTEYCGITTLLGIYPPVCSPLQSLPSCSPFIHWHTATIRRLRGLITADSSL